MYHLDASEEGPQAAAAEAVEELRRESRRERLEVFVSKVLRAMGLNAKRTTRQTYRSSLRQWSNFSTEHGHSFMPPSYKGVYAWMEHQAESGLKASTIELRLKVVVLVAKLLSYSDPRDEEGDLGRRRMRGLLSGVRKERPPSYARALTLEEVRRMIDSSEGFQGTRNRAMLALGFLGALRCSELVGLREQDIETGAEGVRVWLRSSKGDRGMAGESVYAKDIPGVIDLSVLMRRWLRVRDGRKRMKGWRKWRGRDKLFGTSVHGVAAAVARAAKDGRVSQLGLSTHSLRAGCATEAALAGVSQGVVQKHLRHKESKTTARYFRPATKERVAAEISAGIGAR